MNNNSHNISNDQENCECEHNIASNEKSQDMNRFSDNADVLNYEQEVCNQKKQKDEWDPQEQVSTCESVNTMKSKIKKDKFGREYIGHFKNKLNQITKWKWNKLWKCLTRK